MVLAASKFRRQGDGTMAILVDLPMYCPIQLKRSRPVILLGTDGHAHLWLGGRELDDDRAWSVWSQIAKSGNDLNVGQAKLQVAELLETVRARNARTN